MIVAIYSMTLYSQEIVKINEDTLITITERDVKVINSICTDLEYFQEKTKTLENIILADSVLISARDSIIRKQEGIMVRNDKYYGDKISGLEKSLKKEKREKTLLTVILGSVSIILGILAIK